MKKILEVKELSKVIKKKEILNNISFDIYENEIVGFIGPNGAGKSVTMKCIAGLYYPTTGFIKICNKDVIKEHGEAMSNLGISIESPSLYPQLNGFDHFKLIAQYKNATKEDIDNAIKFSNLNQNLQKKTEHYSMGMKQRLALSLAILKKPKLLILDEPTNGLDPDSIFRLRNELLKLKNEGLSILFSSHTLTEVESICDRIIFIKNGLIIDELDNSKNHKEIRYKFYVSDVDKAILITKNIQEVHIINYNDEYIDCKFVSNNSFNILLKELVGKVEITKILNCNDNLETYYSNLYGETL